MRGYLLTKGFTTTIHTSFVVKVLVWCILAMLTIAVSASAKTCAPLKVQSVRIDGSATECQLPFEYDGNTYNTCITLLYPPGLQSLSTTSATTTPLAIFSTIDPIGNVAERPNRKGNDNGNGENCRSCGSGENSENGESGENSRKSGSGENGGNSGSAENGGNSGSAENGGNSGSSENGGNSGSSGNSGNRATRECCGDNKDGVDSWCAQKDKIAQSDEEWGYCNVVQTVGGNAEPSSSCSISECQEGGQALPFSWCNVTEHTWAYCATLPMDSCGFDIARTATKVAGMVHITQNVNSTVLLKDSESLVMQLGNDQHNRMKRNTMINRTQCIVYQEIRHTFSGSAGIVFDSETDGNAITAYQCNDSNCTARSNSPSNFSDSYLRYDTRRDVTPNTSASIVITAHYVINVTIICTSQTEELVPPTVSMAPTTISMNRIQTNDNTASSTTLYIIIGCGFAGVILTILLVAALIMCQRRKRKRTRAVVLNEKVDASSTSPKEQYDNEYHTIGDGYVRMSYVRDNADDTARNKCTSAYGYEEISDMHKASLSTIATLPPLPARDVTTRGNSNHQPTDDNKAPCAQSDIAGAVTIDSTDTDHQREHSRIGLHQNVVSNNETGVCRDDTPENTTRNSNIVMDENNVYNLDASDNHCTNSIVMRSNSVYNKSDNDDAGCGSAQPVEHTTSNSAQHNGTHNDKRDSIIKMEDNDVYNSDTNTDDSVTIGVDIAEDVPNDLEATAEATVIKHNDVHSRIE